MPSDETRATQRSYDRLAAAYRERTRDSHFAERWIALLLEHVEAGGRVVDLGSGPGRHGATLCERGLRAIALDRSLGMHRSGTAEYTVPRVQADHLALPLASGSQRGVFANASLLHLSPPEFGAALDEVARVLAAQGVVFLSLKQGDGARWSRDYYGEPRWFQYWQAEALDAALGRAGLEVLVAEQARGGAAEWLFRFCRKRAAGDSAP